jgi:predicted dehydrogenase
MNAVLRANTAHTRLGFIGLGWIGRKRLDAIASETGIEVAAIADSSAERLEHAAQSYPNAHRAQSIAELLDSRVDGVVIATPNGAHAEQALACLERGIPVFCQKPLATTADATHRVIEAAREANRLLGIDFCYRYVNGMNELKHSIADGRLGEITSIDLKFHNAYGPDKQWCFDRAMAGGGCLLDLGVHLLDLALWLQAFPSMALVMSRQFSNGREVVGHEIEDQAYAELRQENGAIVRLACSWHAPIGCGAIIEATVLGTEGGALWRNVAGSFYDFELFACRGDRREVLASGPDEWGSRALHAWVQRLAVDRSFDSQALGIARSADLIDAIYAA